MTEKFTLHLSQGDRKQLMEELALEQTKQEEVAKELEQYAQCDPDAIKAKSLSIMHTFV
jgi:hypothetical protein